MKKLLGGFILILMLVNLAVIIPFAVYFFHKKDTTFTVVNGVLSYIASSLSADPILDIKAQDDRSSCPQGYYSLLLGTWPGTTDGCDCPSYLRSGVCYKTGRGATEGSCTGISSINPILMYDWGGSEWCALKAKPGSQYNKAAECAKGFRKCSSGICVLETLDCPVTKIKMENGAILTESVASEAPVIGFAITPNDIPCFSDNYFAAGSVTPYVLIDENEDGCSKYGPDDQNSFALGKQKQGNLFEENDFPKKVYNLPEYSKIYKKTDSVLSYQRRLSMTKKDLCLKIDTEVLERSSSITKDLNRFLEGTLEVAIAFHGVQVFFVVWTIAIGICMRTSFGDILQGEGLPKGWILFYILFGFLEYIDFIVMFAATTHFRAKMIGIKDYLGELAEGGCFLDLQTQTAVDDYQTVVNVVAGNYFRYSLSMFLIGSFAVFFVGLCCGK